MESQRNYEYNPRKTGVMYHEVHIYRLLHKWSFSLKVQEIKTCNAVIGGCLQEVDSGSNW